MSDKPLVSIVVILKDFFHLANLTLQSIVNQSETDYEIIVIETASTKRDLVMLKPFSDKITIMQHSNDKTDTTLMNMGVKLAKGQYIHFFFSGDTYVSKYVISYLKELINNNRPDLICCAFLRRDQISPPETVNFSFEYFKRGKIPMHIQSCWFLKDTIDNLEGFDSNYKIKAGFDLICRIFLKEDKKVIFSNRVLTDYQFKKRSSKIFLFRSWESIKIIYSNFGLVKTFFWWLIHDHFRMLKLLLVSIQKAFWNP